MRKWLVVCVPLPFFSMMWAACSSSPTGSDGGADVTVTDSATMDKKVIPDVGMMEAAATCPTPASSIDTSMIQWVPPVTPNPTACTATQASTYFDDCWGTSSSSTLCNAFTGSSANTACAACLSTASTASAYGVIVVYTGIGYDNQAGCVAVEMGDLSSTGCGAKIQAVTQCENLACLTNCPVTDQASLTLFQQCAAAADMGVCSQYATAANAGACNLADSGADGAAQAGAICESATDFQGLYNAISPVFCGDYTPADAGDAGADSD
jgi:hypothetical protein